MVKQECVNIKHSPLHQKGHLVGSFLEGAFLLSRASFAQRHALLVGTLYILNTISPGARTDKVGSCSTRPAPRGT